MELLVTVPGCDVDAVGKNASEDFDVFSGDELVFDFIFTKVKNINLFLNGHGFQTGPVES